MFKIRALLLDEHYTSNNKKEKSYRKKKLEAELSKIES